MKKDWRPAILNHLFNHPGATCHEVVSSVRGLTINSASGRLFDLKASGRVYCCGKIYCTATEAWRSQYRLTRAEHNRQRRMKMSEAAA